jgi:hypothetical protein
MYVQQKICRFVVDLIYLWITTVTYTGRTLQHYTVDNFIQQKVHPLV